MDYVYKVEARELDNGILGQSLTGSPKVTTSSTIRYIVTIYQSNGTTRYSGTGISVNWEVTGSSSSNLNWEDYFKKKGIESENTINFVSDITAKGKSTVEPTFTVAVNGVEATLSGSIPTPIFTLAAVTKLPTVPSQITADLQGTLSNTSNIYYNPCPDAVNNVWAAHIITFIPSTGSQMANSYSHVVKFYKKDGSAGATKQSFGIDVSLSPKDLTSKDTAYSKTLKYLIDFKSGVFCPSNTKAMTGTSSFITSAYTGPRWNPPNHKVTRGDSHGERITGGHAEKDKRLGYMYSNTDYTTSTLEVPVLMSSTGKAPSPANAAWGFRFHYNPSEFTYTTAVMAGLNIESIQKDPSELIPGNTSITLGLVLNRQLDMHLLDKNNPERVNWDKYYDSSVRGSLTADQLDYFRTRGTEYDLEFFYRIVSAKEPTKRTLLTNGDVTSDLGFVTVQPFWLTLHDNMNYFVKLESIQVTHRAFTKDMVPYLTEVTLSMSRMMTPELDITKVPNKTLPSSHVISTPPGSTGP